MPLATAAVTNRHLSTKSQTTSIAYRKHTCSEASAMVSSTPQTPTCSTTTTTQPRLNSMWTHSYMRISTTRLPITSTRKPSAPKALSGRSNRSKRASHTLHHRASRWATRPTTRPPPRHRRRLRHRPRQPHIRCTRHTTNCLNPSRPNPSKQRTYSSRTYPQLVFGSYSYSLSLSRTLVSISVINSSVYYVNTPLLLQEQSLHL
jgi:hypothetical protein